MPVAVFRGPECMSMTPPQSLGPESRAHLLKLAAWASVVVAGILILGKLVAWLASGSVALMASLVDSFMDALASSINLLAVRWSLQPADDEHRFGYGKAEALAGLGQATFIIGSAVFLLLEAVDRFLHPKPLTSVALGVGVLVFAILATLVLLAIQRHVIRLTGSTAIKADSLHYATDIITNLSTLAALLLSVFGWDGADPFFALAIAVSILYSAIQIGREAIGLLLDHELPRERCDEILRLVFAHPRVLGVHDMRTRQSGYASFVQLHIELDDNLPLWEAHEVSDGLERKIREVYPGAEVIIHEDPCGHVDHSRVRCESRPD